MTRDKRGCYTTILLVIALVVLLMLSSCASSRQYRRVNEKKIVFTKRDASNVVVWFWGGYIIGMIIRESIKWK